MRRQAASPGDTTRAYFSSSAKVWNVLETCSTVLAEGRLDPITFSESA